MDLTLRGDYFNGEFTAKNGLSSKDINSSNEAINKFCPGDLSHKLWDAQVNYSNIDKVIDSAIDGYSAWRKLDITERVNFFLSRTVTLVFLSVTFSLVNSLIFTAGNSMLPICVPRISPFT